MTGRWRRSLPSRALSGLGASRTCARSGPRPRSQCCPPPMARGCRNRCSKRPPAGVRSSRAIFRAAARSYGPAGMARAVGRDRAACPAGPRHGVVAGDRGAGPRPGAAARDGAGRAASRRARLCRGADRRANVGPVREGAARGRTLSNRRARKRPARKPPSERGGGGDPGLAGDRRSGRPRLGSGRRAGGACRGGPESGRIAAHRRAVRDGARGGVGCGHRIGARPRAAAGPAAVAGWSFAVGIVLFSGSSSRWRPERKDGSVGSRRLAAER